MNPIHKSHETNAAVSALNATGFFTKTTMLFHTLHVNIVPYHDHTEEMRMEIGIVSNINCGGILPYVRQVQYRLSGL